MNKIHDFLFTNNGWILALIVLVGIVAIVLSIFNNNDHDDDSDLMNTSISNMNTTISNSSINL